jgi:hypothetical protein
LLQADRFAAEVLELADGCAEDPAAVAKARVQVDARKWSAARMAPRKWCDRAQVDLGGQADQPVAIRFSWAEPRGDAAG